MNVIERMVEAFDEAYRTRFRDPNAVIDPKESTRDAMLAAVRELRNIAANSAPALADEYLAAVVEKHERRSEGKGGDS